MGEFMKGMFKKVKQDESNFTRFPHTANREYLVKSNDEGIERVINDDGKYAFLMESKSIQYKIERNCKLHQVGGELDNKGYGIPMRKGSKYKPLIDGTLVKLQEGGFFHKATVTWWKQKRGGGACVGGGGGGGVAELGMQNVIGVFVFTGRSTANGIRAGNSNAVNLLMWPILVRCVCK